MIDAPLETEDIRIESSSETDASRKVMLV
jgi:hypothetical protein